MSFDTIPGQEMAKRLLQNGLRNHTLSHAYIFSGPQGSGRKQMARMLAQAVHCQELVDDACGHCLECRKQMNGNHPDVHWLEPDGQSIKIDQIRELQKAFSYRGSASKMKIYIIDRAERMTVQAANSLLKFLEEPLQTVMAILITDNGQALLPTIRSRAQEVKFVPMNSEYIQQVLEKEGFAGSMIRPAAVLAAGVDAARELIQEEWFAEARRVMLQLAEETLERSSACLITVQQQLTKSDWSTRLPTVMDLFILLFKDMILICSGCREKVIYIDQVDWMSKHALAREVCFWVYCMEQTVEAQKRLRFNANPQLTLEKLLIDIQGGYHCTQL